MDGFNTLCAAMVALNLSACTPDAGWSGLLPVWWTPR